MSDCRADSKQADTQAVTTSWKQTVQLHRRSKCTLAECTCERHVRFIGVTSSHHDLERSHSCVSTQRQASLKTSLLRLGRTVACSWFRVSSSSEGQVEPQVEATAIIYFQHRRCRKQLICVTGCFRLLWAPWEALLRSSQNNGGHGTESCGWG